MGRKVVLQGRLSHPLLDKSGGFLLRRYEGEARRRKIKEPGGQLHPSLLHQTKVEAIVGLFTSSPINRAHAPKSDAKDDLIKSE